MHRPPGGRPGHRPGRPGGVCRRRPVRPARHPRRERRGLRLRIVLGDLRRDVARHDRRRPDRDVQVDAGRSPPDDRPGRRPDHRDVVDGRPPGQPEPGPLHRGEVGRHRAHEDARPRGGRPRDHCQRRLSGDRRHADGPQRRVLPAVRAGHRPADEGSSRAALRQPQPDPCPLGRPGRRLERGRLPRCPTTPGTSPGRPSTSTAARPRRCRNHAGRARRGAARCQAGPPVVGMVRAGCPGGHRDRRADAAGSGGPRPDHRRSGRPAPSARSSRPGGRPGGGGSRRGDRHRSRPRSRQRPERQRSRDRRGRQHDGRPDRPADVLGHGFDGGIERPGIGVGSDRLQSERLSASRVGGRRRPARPAPDPVRRRHRVRQRAGHRSGATGKVVVVARPLVAVRCDRHVRGDGAERQPGGHPPHPRRERGDGHRAGLVDTERRPGPGLRRDREPGHAGGGRRQGDAPAVDPRRGEEGLLQRAGRQGLRGRARAPPFGHGDDARDRRLGRPAHRGVHRDILRLRLDGGRYQRAPATEVATLQQVAQAGGSGPATSGSDGTATTT